MKKRKAYELEIIDLAPGGKGIAKPDGFPVFVDQSLPGDIVFAKIVRKRKAWAEGKLIKILKASSLRKEGRCMYCGFCGGCKWQQMEYDVQLGYKKRHVQESLLHIGKLKDIMIRDVIPSDRIFGYRNKMEFSCSTSRWLLPHELQNSEIMKGFGIGLHVPGTFDRVIDIKRCEIMPDLGNSILGDVREFIRESGLPPYHLRTHEGFWRFLMLRHSSAFDKWMVNIVTKEKNIGEVSGLGALLKDKYPEIESIVNNITDSTSGISAGREEIVLQGRDHIKEKLGDFVFRISANSFFQTNTGACEKLYSKVSEYADLTGKETVIDLYSGTGTIPIWLSGRAKIVYGIEIIEDAVIDAKNNAELNNVKNCKFIQGDIKEVLPRLGEKPDLIVIDPPRTGMHKDVIRQVTGLNPEKIIYVSCNPSTLARDIEIFYSEYHVKEIQLFDMFPHTHHIESVALLEKRACKKSVSLQIMPGS